MNKVKFKYIIKQMNVRFLIMAIIFCNFVGLLFYIADGGGFFNITFVNTIAVLIIVSEFLQIYQKIHEYTFTTPLLKLSSEYAKISTKVNELEYLGIDSSKERVFLEEYDEAIQRIKPKKEQTIKYWEEQIVLANKPSYPERIRGARINFARLQIAAINKGETVTVEE